MRAWAESLVPFRRQPTGHSRFPNSAPPGAPGRAQAKAHEGKGGSGPALAPREPVRATDSSHQGGTDSCREHEHGMLFSDTIQRRRDTGVGEMTLIAYEILKSFQTLLGGWRGLPGDPDHSQPGPALPARTAGTPGQPCKPPLSPVLEQHLGSLPGLQVTCSL